MSRSKRPSNNHAKSQDVKDVVRELKLIRQHARDILKSQGKTIREFRKEAAVLKKLGIISKRTDIRKLEPTRYRRSQLRRNFDFIVGTAIPVKAPKDVREKYVEKGLFKSRGRFLVVPAEHKDMKAKIRKGVLETTVPIGPRVKMRSIILPYNAADLLDLANRIEHDPNIASELDGVDQYAFSLFGHTSHVGFQTKADLVEYIKLRYRHLFSGENGHMAVKHFKLVTYTTGTLNPPEIPAEEKFYTKRGSNRSDESWGKQQSLKRHAIREKKRRARLSEGEQAAYREAAKARAKASRERAKNERDV